MAPDAARTYRLYLDEPLPPSVRLIPLPSDLERAVPRRQLQFRAGRYCAIKAMDALGLRFPAASVCRGEGGAPIWPDGLVGSITHTDDFVSAAVARKADVRALGIDTERVMLERVARNVGRIIAWPAEVAHGRAAGLTRLEALTLIFSAKESIFKCLYPLVACYFDFHDVRIVEVDASNRVFTARVVRTLSGAFPAQTMLPGRFNLEGEWVHTAMALTE